MRQPDWQTDDGSIRLYLGDCLETLPTLSGIDAIVTDPPYGVGFKGKRAVQRDGSKREDSEGYIGFDDTYENVKTIVVPAIEMALEKAKRGAVTPGTRCMFLYPCPRDVGCLYSAAGTGLSSWGFTCSQPIFWYGSDPYLQTGARPNSLGQTYPNDANCTGHPCAKPLPVTKWLVLRASIPKETILDPFMGSGTTGVACVRTGRKFIGIEKEPKYFDIAVRRIEAELNRTPLFEAAPKIVQRELLTA